MRSIFHGNVARSLVLFLSLASVVLASIALAQSPNAGADDSAALDRAAVEAYRRGDLEGARGLWLSMLASDDARNADPALALNASKGAASKDGAADGATRSSTMHASTSDANTGSTHTLPAAERARVLYDLGNVAYRQKKILEAVGWYSAALRLTPRDADLWWNLEHARSEAKLEPADRGDLSGTLRRLLSSFTLAESEWLVIGVLAAWSALLAIEALRGGRVWRRLALAGALVLAASLVPWLFNVKRASEHPLLAIQDGKLEVRSEPRADAPAIAELAAGDEAEAIDALPEWTKVELASGVQGWARKNGLFALDR
jgi:tetratricopeptide (TPR) repeat protein